MLRWLATFLSLAAFAVISGIFACAWCSRSGLKKRGNIPQEPMGDDEGKAA